MIFNYSDDLNSTVLEMYEHVLHMGTSEIVDVTSLFLKLSKC